MHLPQIVALGAAITATSSFAAPLIPGSSSNSNDKQLNPISYRATAGGSFGSMAPQALFAIPSKEKLIKRSVIPSRDQSIQRRKPSAGLQVVLNYVNKLTRSTKSQEEEEDDEEYEDEDEDEEDGSDPSHYYQPINKRNNQQPFSVAGKRAANLQCGVKATSTSTAPTKTPTSTQVVKPTSSSLTSTKISSTTTAPVATSSSTAPAQGKNGGGLVTGYWPEWSVGTLAPENIAWSMYDYVYYAFGIPTSSGSITLDNTALLKRFVTAAHKGNSKAILSIGGWGQSSGFSASVASDSARANFITNILKVISTYNLDGVDFDWEYPGNVQGGTSNPADTGNFQTFLQQLRAKFPTGKIMTAAVPQQVWQGSNGNPVGSVARAGGALDHIVIMNYDVWGSSKTPGPNAPLANLCGNSTQPVASAAGGVKAWTSAGFPRNKILLGVPAYGYLNPSSRNYLVQRDLSDGQEEIQESIQERSEGNVILKADRPDIRQQKLNKRATLTSSDNSHTSGQINFNTLISQGALKANPSTGNYDATGGFTKYWDNCSDTPYLSNGNIVVTYDDPDSLYDKADFSRLAGIAGVAMWSIDGDTSDNALISSLAAGLKGT